MIPFRYLTICAALTAFTLATPAYSDNAPTVDAPAGVVKGQSDGSQNIFKGIPYATPPVGALRWKAPVPLPRWRDVKNATAARTSGKTRTTG